MKANDDGTVHFTCPGCGDEHVVNVKEGSPRPRWIWNGSLERPTFHPSILVRSGHYVPHHKEGDSCWCSFNAELRAKGEPEEPFSCYLCHSFVCDGMIQFLDDCSHALAGKTVPLS